MKLRIAKKILANKENPKVSYHAEQLAKADNRMKRQAKKAKA
jgi:hypothetical protein